MAENPNSLENEWSEREGGNLVLSAFSLARSLSLSLSLSLIDLLFQCHNFYDFHRTRTLGRLYMYIRGIFVLFCFCLLVFCLFFVLFLFSKKKMFTVVPNAPMLCACMIKISTSLGLTPCLHWMEHVLFCLLLAFSIVQLLGGIRSILCTTSSFHCTVTGWNTFLFCLLLALSLYSYWMEHVLFCLLLSLSLYSYWVEHVLFCLQLAASIVQLVLTTTKSYITIL